MIYDDIIEARDKVKGRDHNLAGAKALKYFDQFPDEVAILIDGYLFIRAEDYDNLRNNMGGLS